jgi:hypothetical protein
MQKRQASCNPEIAANAAIRRANRDNFSNGAWTFRQQA